MLLERVIFRYYCRKNDKKAQREMRIPDEVERRVNIPYGKHGKWNLLDVYYPAKNNKPLPVIISIHGGGYVYGTKDIYKFYCMDLARRGFAVVNFSYRLAPKVKFPVPVIETNEVMQWVCSNAAGYLFDLNNIFLTGDSAGAQIASQYSAMVTNTEYAGLFGLDIPLFKLRAIALICGMYDMSQEVDPSLPALIENYFGKDLLAHGEKINVLKYINNNYPASFIVSSANDFLLPCARPMFEYLQGMGVESIMKIYGTKDQKEIGHVFHLNILSAVARQCNDDTCDFFRRHVAAECQNLNETPAFIK